MSFFPVIFLAFLYLGVNAQDTTIAETLQNIYYNCSSSDSLLSCAKPKVLSYLSEVMRKDKVLVTQDLTLARSFKVLENEQDEEKAKEYFTSKKSLDFDRKELLRSLMLEKLDDYLGSHYLEAKLPDSIVESNVVPRSLVDSVPKSIRIPLVETECTNEQVQGRGFVKKVVIPFLLGLKFKATALVPLALALIALKTWKALTLGLLSIVLSGALLIFKLTKPKIAYEVVHYGHPPVEHPPHWETSPTGPYRGYKK